MVVLSSLDFWFPLFVIAGALLLWRGGFRGRAMLVCLLISVGLMEGLVINPVKKAVGRPRPNEVLADARIIGVAPKPKPEEASASPAGRAGLALASTVQFRALFLPVRAQKAKIKIPPRPGKSFPSGHVSNMFCMAVILTAFYGRRGAWFFLVAALVSISRIATGSHWPSDVILTAALSSGITLGLIALYAWLWRIFAPKWIPALAARHPTLLARA